ncbi:MAG: VOC family protein [Deltaproteobacteria bacterium]|nr:VOC family protein [Deltaproteobacteria bacterium]
MRISQFALTVREYDEAIAFFVEKLGFGLIEDTDLGNGKRWVRVASGAGLSLLLARATTPEQLASVGNQAGGRVFIFLETDNFWRDYELFRSRGIEFVRPPKEEEYGTVAVFKDLYGNLWDLLQSRGSARP